MNIDKNSKCLRSLSHHNDSSKDDVIVKLEKELKHCKNIIEVLEERAGPSRIPDTETSSEDDEIVHRVTAETQQIDEAFSGYHIFTTDVSFLYHSSNNSILIIIPFLCR